MPERFKAYAYDKRAFLYAAFDLVCQKLGLDAHVLSRETRNQIGNAIISAMQAGHETTDDIVREALKKLNAA